MWLRAIHTLEFTLNNSKLTVLPLILFIFKFLITTLAEKEYYPKRYYRQYANYS